MAGSTPSLVSFAAQFLAVCVLVVSRATLHALAVRLPPELRVLRAVPPTLEIPRVVCGGPQA
jgi:hypothetical protein